MLWAEITQARLVDSPLAHISNSEDFTLPFVCLAKHFHILHWSYNWPFSSQLDKLIFILGKGSKPYFCRNVCCLSNLHAGGLIRRCSLGFNQTPVLRCCLSLQDLAASITEPDCPPSPVIKRESAKYKFFGCLQCNVILSCSGTDLVVT